MNKYNKQLQEMTKTYCRSFILPLFTDLLVILNSYKENLVNTYISDTRNNRYITTDDNKYLFVLIINTDDGKFKHLDGALHEIKEFVETYPIDKYLNMYVYHLNPEFNNDYNTYLNGKYSQFSENAKGILLAQSQPWGVCYQVITRKKPVDKRYQDLREYWKEKLGEALPEDGELWSIPNLETEVFDYDRFTESLQPV